VAVVAWCTVRTTRHATRKGRDTGSTQLQGAKQHSPGRDCRGDAEGQHEAHGIGGLVDGHSRQLPLSIWQQPSHHHHQLTCPPLGYQQHACHSISCLSNVVYSEHITIWISALVVQNLSIGPFGSHQHACHIIPCLSIVVQVFSMWFAAKAKSNKPRIKPAL